MGQKVNPIGIRLGFTKKSNSFWYPNDRSFASILKDDIEIRDFILNYFKNSVSIGNVFIERISKNIRIIISTPRPGFIIGKRGEDIEKLRIKLSFLYKISVNINVEEIKYPDLNASVVANNIGMQLQRRIMFRRIMKRVIINSIKQGAKGIKVSLSGRLGGADIARREWSKEGKIPLHTFKADIDYCVHKVKTSYGLIGIKVWIYKGEFKKN